MYVMSKSTDRAPAATDTPSIEEISDPEDRQSSSAPAVADDISDATAALASPAQQLMSRRSRQTPALSENLRDRRQIRAERQELNEQRLAIEMERIELDHTRSELSQERRRLERATERLNEDRKQLISERDQLRSERLALAELRKRLPDNDPAPTPAVAEPTGSDALPVGVGRRRAPATTRRWRHK